MGTKNYWIETKNPQTLFLLGRVNYLTYPSLDRPLSQPQTASDPISHVATIHFLDTADRQTDRWDRRQLCTKSAYAHALWTVSDALKTPLSLRKQLVFNVFFTLNVWNKCEAIWRILVMFPVRNVMQVKVNTFCGTWLSPPQPSP